VVNRLARTDPSAPGKLAELAGALRAAQQAGHGPRLRELSAARGALVDALTAQALGLAGLPDPPPSLRLEVAETLTAALADPEVAAAFAEGTLTRAEQWSGFGVPPADADTDEGTDGAPAGETVEAGETHPSGPPSHRAAGSGAGRERADGTSERASVRARGRRRSGAALAGQTSTGGRPAAAARRQADEEEQPAREAAERAARRREQHEDAERVVVVASTAAAEAVSAEDRLEVEVRDLEQRLARARAGLAAARMRARHAEAAERRATQALNQLPRS
jgi:hypothetical protein